MKAICFAASVFCGLALSLGTAHADQLVVDGPHTISTNTTYESVLVRSGGTLTLNATLTVTDTMIVESDGLVTHDVGHLSGLALNIGTLLLVQPNGRINVSTRGLRGGLNSQTSASAQAYNSSGVLTTNSSTHVGGGHGGVGGLSSSSWVYDQIENPTRLGSGGGVGGTLNGCCASPGGNGGGLIRIVAPSGSVVIDGFVWADGQPGDWQATNARSCGGGAGGSIYIQAASISGGGTIRAAGGRAVSTGGAGGAGGSGGGGRIALLYDSRALPTANVTAPGGSGPNPASAGTVYMRASATNASVLGTLTIDNANISSGLYTPLRTALTTLQSINFLRRGQLVMTAGGFPSPLTVQAPLVLNGTVKLWTAGAFTLSLPNDAGFDVDVTAGGEVRFDAGLTPQFDRLRVSGATSVLITSANLTFSSATGFELSGGASFTNNAVFTIPDFDGTNIQSGKIVLNASGRLNVLSNEIELVSGVELTKDGSFGAIGDEVQTLVVAGTLTHSLTNLSGLVLNVTQTLDILATGKIDVSARGLKGAFNSGQGSGAQAYASNGSLTTNTQTWTGGSHGGVGGLSSSSWVYDQFENPTRVGSGGCRGGASNGCCAAPGGNGGGLVRVVAPMAAVVVNGAILADGQAGDWRATNAETGGGGAGGAIYLAAQSLGGAGIVRAAGGRAVSVPGNYGGAGGSGGGGRIALVYDAMTLPVANVTAPGGSGPNPGGVGTVLVSNTRVGPDLTTTDPFLTLSPDGSIIFRVTMRDSDGDPIVGETGVWLDFSGCTGLVPCPSIAATWPILQQSAPSSWGGLVEFAVKAGGCTSGLVAVRSAQGLVASVPVKSLDRNGTLTVSAFDFAADACSDYNNDGTTNVDDWDMLARYIGRTCISDASSYFTVDAYTQPGPDRLYPGSIIQVWAKIHNTAPEPAVLDSVVFETAGWGIANSWKFLSRELSVAVPASGDIYDWAPFTIPSGVPRHGCFRVRSYPRFAVSTAAMTTGTERSAGYSLQSATSSSQGNKKQINRDSRPAPCPNGSSTVVAEEQGSAGRRYALTADRLARASAGASMTATEWTSIPIGTEFGSQLTLFQQAFLPPGWSYTISHSTISAPDTILVGITHPVPVACADTARVVVQAYATGEVYAGEAEVYVYALGPLGDVDASWTTDSLDVYSMKDWLLGGPDLANPDAMDLTGDALVDVADLVRLVDAVYDGAELDCAQIPEAQDYSVRVWQDADSTTVFFDPNRSIRAAQILLLGTGSGGARSSFDGILELSTATSGDSLAVLLTDLDGTSPIEGPMAYVRLQGSYSFLGGRFADAGYHPGNIVIEPVPVLISEFSAEPGNSGVSLKWKIRGDEEVLGFALYRRTGVDGALVAIASESELVASARAFTDRNVKGGHTYEYVLGVRVANGTEFLSGTVDATAKKFELSLFQNHPNPFNPATTITFTVPERMEVQLAIYNVRGQLVKTVLAERLDEGFHEARWEGKDNAGSPVSSGVYFYRLIAGKRALTKKMVLLK